VLEHPSLQKNLPRRRLATKQLWLISLDSEAPTRGGHPDLFQRWRFTSVSPPTEMLLHRPGTMSLPHKAIC
jgi:hypothetical protein